MQSVGILPRLVDIKNNLWMIYNDQRHLIYSMLIPMLGFFIDTQAKTNTRSLRLVLQQLGLLQFSAQGG